MLCQRTEPWNVTSFKTFCDPLKIGFVEQYTDRYMHYHFSYTSLFVVQVQHLDPSHFYNYVLHSSSKLSLIDLMGM